MLKSSGFQTLKIYKISSECDRDVLFFFLLKADTQANPWIFSDSAKASTVSGKNS
jgi:hypothetical protein